MAEKATIEVHSKEKVAYDLMVQIALSEGQEKSREYLLNLYVQCRRVVVDGWNAREALEEG